MITPLKPYQHDPDLSGGCACLNFTNTVGGRRPDRPREYLNSYTDLLAWSLHAGLLSEAQAEHLAGEAERCPAEAAQILAEAITLREAIYRIFSATARAEPALAEDLSILNSALGKALARLQVRPDPPGFSWCWSTAEDSLEAMLWPVARSAAELLTSADLARVRECAGDVCSWLFLDTSRNHTRRWCDMRDCGNRAKARRHYARSRGTEGTEGTHRN